MPQRVRNHVLESLSRDAFSRLITGPLGWVVRDVQVDYGIDLEVEVFAESGQTTGLTFKVQLKGMETPDHLGPFRDIKVDHLRYWGRLDVPVLLIAYDDSTQTVFGRWTHALDVSLKPGQKSVRIRFDQEDAITSGDARLLATVETVRRFKTGGFGRPYPVRLAAPASSLDTHDFFGAVQDLGLDGFLRLDRSDFCFEIALTSSSVRVALPGDIGSMTLHTQSLDIEPSAGDSLAVLAAMLARVNRYGEAIQIANCVVGRCVAPRSPEVAIELATAGYEVGDHEGILRLTVDALSCHVHDAAQVYLLALRQIPGTYWMPDARSVLEPAIERCIDRAVAEGRSNKAAFWAYNYAQFLYGKKAHSEARPWIERALELDPSGYGSRPEPQRLLGGVAWFARDFSESVKAYRSAVALGGLSAAGSQLADSLLHAGRYSDAKYTVTQVLQSGSTNWRDWFIDAIAEELVDHLGVSRQNRREFPPVGTVLTGLRVERLEQYLKDGDGLNPSVWTARCLKHPCDRLTTLMAGAYLSNQPILMAAAVHQMLHYWEEFQEPAKEMMVGLFRDRADVKEVLLANDAPICDKLERELIAELSLQSLERAPVLPGIQLVDENNVPQATAD